MARNDIVELTPEVKALLRQSGSNRPEEATAAVREIALALEEPLRKGIMAGDIVSDIFQTIEVDKNTTPEFELDFLAPGTEKEHVAFTIPYQGHIPQRHIDADYVQVPVFPIGEGMDWNIDLVANSRTDVLRRAMNVFEGGFIKKTNDDGWHTLLSAAVDRNIVVYDADANAGQFTKRLISMGKLAMRRNGGGNSSSNNRGLLTDIYLSPEAIEDVPNWNVDQLDEISRRDVLVGDQGTISRLFKLNFHDIDEFGEDQEYQGFLINSLGAVLPSGDLEFAIGLDLRNTDSFVMPVRDGGRIEMHEDMTLQRQRRAGVFGWKFHGFGVLDNRRIILLSM